jgi:hypothetical protein
MAAWRRILLSFDRSGYAHANFLPEHRKQGTPLEHFSRARAHS